MVVKSHFRSTFILLTLLFQAFAAPVCTRPINIGYNVEKASGLATSLAKSNWEWGTQSEALLELSDPDISVFSDTAFAGGKIPDRVTASTTYAKQYIKITGNTLTAVGGKFVESLLRNGSILTSTSERSRPSFSRRLSHSSWAGEFRILASSC